MRVTTNSSPNRMDWSSRLVGMLAGVAAGISTNISGGNVVYRVVAVTASLAITIFATARIRALPPRARPVRYGSELLLALSFSAALVAQGGSPRQAADAIVVAVLFAFAFVFVPSDSANALRLLAGATAIGLGVAALINHSPLSRIAAIVMGVASIGFGGAVLNSLACRRRQGGSRASDRCLRLPLRSLV